MTVPALVLAGGLGTRLREITGDRCPKPMAPVEVDGTPYPFLEFPLGHLYAQGVRDALICIGHLGEQIQRHFGDGKRFGMRFTYDDAGESLTATRLQHALRHITAPVVLVVCGDVFQHLELEPFLARFHAQPRWLLQLAAYTGPISVTHNVALADDGTVIGFNPGGVAGNRTGVETGTLALRPRALENLNPEQQLALTDDIYPGLIAQRALGAFPTMAEFFDIGTPAGYRHFCAHAKAGSAPPLSLLG